MNVRIVNYGMGNLGSVRRALQELGCEPQIAALPADLEGAERIVLPGVGGFAEGMARLREGGWIEPLRRYAVQERRPMLGICLGMQMLANSSEEGGAERGLDLIPGRVRHLAALGCRSRIPHVGWNEVSFTADEPLFAHVPQRADFYFVHSYAFEAIDSASVIGVATYGVQVTAAVRAANIFGTQFHPEKSSRAGRQVLKNFLEYAAC